jgi:hypothetical protein
MVVPRPKEEILAELRAEQARDRVRAQDQAGWRRGGQSAPNTTPTAVGPGPEPVPGRPGTWRMATFEQQQLIADLMEHHVVPPERVERVQAVIDGRDPCPPTLTDWLMTLPRREKAGAARAAQEAADAAADGSASTRAAHSDDAR